MRYRHSHKEATDRSQRNKIINDRKSLHTTGSDSKCEHTTAELNTYSVRGLMKVQRNGQCIQNMAYGHLLKQVPNQYSTEKNSQIRS